MTIHIRAEDLAILSMSNNASLFEARGYPWPHPDKQLEIRNGPVDGEFWRERHIFGPFRPTPCAPQRHNHLHADPAPRLAANIQRRKTDSIAKLVRRTNRVLP